MLRDILSRSGSRPQQQSQPALLPDKKGRQRLLEGGATLGKFDFHAHAAHAKAVGAGVRYMGSGDKKRLSAGGESRN